MSMRQVSILYRKKKYVVDVTAENYKYQYEYDHLEDAKKRAARICDFIDIKTFSIKI